MTAGTSGVTTRAGSGRWRARPSAIQTVVATANAVTENARQDPYQRPAMRMSSPMKSSKRRLQRSSADSTTLAIGTGLQTAQRDLAQLWIVTHVVHQLLELLGDVVRVLLGIVELGRPDREGAIGGPVPSAGIRHQAPVLAAHPVEELRIDLKRGEH